MKFGDDGLLLILDGALGTELDKAGLTAVPPLWTTRAVLEFPDAVRRVHEEYIAAGCDIITAATFRTNPKALAGTEYENLSAEITEKAIRIARTAASASGRPIKIAASAAPAEDCFSPELIPDNETLIANHRQHIRNCAEAGADIILIETMNSLTESVIALEAAECELSGSGKPAFWISCSLKSENTLHDGTDLKIWAEAVNRHNPDFVLINCTHPDLINSGLKALREAGIENFGAYANTTKKVGDRYIFEAGCITGAEYRNFAAEWIETGAKIIGGCCGTDASHIRAISDLIRCR